MAFCRMQLLIHGITSTAVQLEGCMCNYISPFHVDFITYLWPNINIIAICDMEDPGVLKALQKKHYHLPNLLIMDTYLPRSHPTYAIKGLNISNYSMMA